MYGKIWISTIFLMLAALAANLPGGARDVARVEIAQTCTADELAGAEASQSSVSCKRGAGNAMPVMQCPTEQHLMADFRQVSALPRGAGSCGSATRQTAASLPASIDPPPPRVVFRT